jgi:ketosteroid isomerase-like protein
VNAHDLVLAWWRAANARDWEAFAALHAEDVVYEVPQTRERVRGRANYVEFNRSWPGAWVAEVQRVVAEGEHAVSWIHFLVDGQTMTGICFFDFKDGLVSRITDWWPEPYEPPARMTDKIERY